MPRQAWCSGRRLREVIGLFRRVRTWRKVQTSDAKTLFSTVNDDTYLLSPPTYGQVSCMSHSLISVRLFGGSLSGVEYRNNRHVMSSGVYRMINQLRLSCTFSVIGKNFYREPCILDVTMIMLSVIEPYRFPCFHWTACVLHCPPFGSVSGAHVCNRDCFDPSLPFLILFAEFSQTERKCRWVGAASSLLYYPIVADLDLFRWFALRSS